VSREALVRGVLFFAALGALPILLGKVNKYTGGGAISSYFRDSRPLPLGPLQIAPSEDGAQCNGAARQTKAARWMQPERQRVIDAAMANLKQHYVYQDVAQKMADALLAHEKRVDYDAISDGGTLADLLTNQLRDVSHDMHLVLVYSQATLPEHATGTTPEGLARHREIIEQENCTFEKVAILPRNFGYLKLNSFPDPSVCRQTAMAAWRLHYLF
jgi:hypothetical protein